MKYFLTAWILNCFRHSVIRWMIFIFYPQQLNYMDPRISVAFCKRNEVPIEKIFSKTLRDKFNWAMAVSPDWLFNEEIGKQG